MKYYNIRQAKKMEFSKFFNDSVSKHGTVNEKEGMGKGREEA